MKRRTFLQLMAATMASAMVGVPTPAASPVVEEYPSVTYGELEGIVYTHWKIGDYHQTTYYLGDGRCGLATVEPQALLHVIEGGTNGI